MQEKSTKKIVTVQDISGFGQCSITVALPVLSALGYETAVCPVSVFTAHNGFDNVSIYDLTEEIPKFAECWKKNNLKFSALYSGYLQNEKQIDYTMQLYKEIKTDDTILIVDPAMADNGKLYKGHSDNYIKKMAEYCKFADVICPNITEAEFMLGNSEVKKIYTEDEIKNKVKLFGNGKSKRKKVVITGIPFEDNKLVTVSYDGRDGSVDLYYQERIKGNYYGTGDIFASVLTGLILKSHTLAYATRQAADFVTECINSTKNDIQEHWYGVHFEKNLKLLTEMI